MGPNCQSKIHLELLGKGLATMKMFTIIIIINIIIHIIIIIMTLIIPLFISSLAPDEDEYTRDEIWEQMIRQVFSISDRMIT